ncbi:NAD-dependent epimerase/dehydratase family protein [Actinomadura litoris]|uniref:NAD-dependent epimerase/dehydratase family protein n=1 Tax=Actinomadura litoris TaxID=2678616 RepID=A0A7K1LA86_9ACTN|nr:NAD(P)-dependent oxidoreductase [Actinomadura litoris]MUN41146.1 NAD-dependent epimerase/dehydratase family protein [Actinomadura litoris]
MILVTGGMGFIGSHTVQALLDLGESCVLLQRRPAEHADERVTVEQGDITDLDALLGIGARHEITGIVHLAHSGPWPPDPDRPVEQARGALNGLLNVMRAAQDRGVRRVGVASTIGVYSGITARGALREDMPLPMSAPHSIPTFKKIGELLNGHLADATGIEIVNYRISGTWGPRDPHGALFFAAPELVHAAVQGREPDLSTLLAPAHAEDALDLCYVKDTGRAIALLQLADHLNHRTYNVASGRATTNAEIIASIEQVIPGARVGLPTGGPAGRSHLDIGRLHEDTGFKPEYDTARAVTDYIAWLRAGNEH